MEQLVAHICMKSFKLDELRYEYLISEEGRVFAPHLNRYLNPYSNGLGYLAVKLRTKANYGTRQQFYIHRLVALLYVPNPNNFVDVNHKDGNKSNNHYSNLEWVSKKANSKHAYKLKLLSGFLKYK